MRIIGLFILFAFSNAFLCGDSSNEVGTYPKVIFDFKKDDREWIIGHEISDKLQSMVEYIIKGERAKSAKEVVTVQSFKSKPTDPSAFFQLFVKQLEETNKNNKINSRILKKSDKTAFAEWWIQDNSPNDQHEWIKIFVTDGYISAIRYTTRDYGTHEEIKPVWEEIIGSARIQTVMP